MLFEYRAIKNAKYRIPAITAYHRLEPRPRDLNFDRSLKAEVRDAMWMLTRQWQTGEFIGEDAGSAAKIQMISENSAIDRLSLKKQPPFPYEKNIPLETKIEHEKIPVDFYLRIQMGSYLLKLIKQELSVTFQTIKNELLQKYNLENTYSDETHLNSIKKDKGAFMLYQSTKTKNADGYKIFEEINSSAFTTWLIANGTISDPDKQTIKNLCADFINWFKRLYSQPESDSDSAWIPSQLEYQFEMAAPAKNNSQIKLSADQYYSGNLDWYALDNQPGTLLKGDLIDESKNKPPATKIKAYLPASVILKGMPNARFWEMEDRQTNFGALDSSTTGLLHMLLAEFGLVYSNDWMVFPHKMDINTISEIKSLIVTDVFGDRTLIRSANGGADNNWQRFSMFSISNKDQSGSYNNLLFLPPTLTKFLESEPVEKVNFIRDEMANMVWAIEDIFPSQLGKGTSGKEYADANAVKRELITESAAKIKYTLGTTVPFNWIPFIPVPADESVSEMKLQRAQMPDFATGGGIKPQGVILNEVKEKYFINEEEVPYSGVIVKRAYQRARWFNGKTYLWLGRRKETGRGQGSSRLRFDIIEDIKTE